MRRLRRHLGIFALALVVVGLGAWWTHRSFEDQLDEGRAQTLARLLATSHTPRMVEAPGVEAWLLDLLQGVGIDDALLRPSDQPPPSMMGVGVRLHRPPPPPVALPPPLDPPYGSSEPESSLRVTKHQRVGEQTLVVSRRRNLFEAEPQLGPDLARAAVHLAAIAESWDERAEGDQGGPAPRVTRVYAVMEDGSFLSHPFGDPARPEADPLEEETRQSQRRPRDPNLVSSVVFREFDFDQPHQQQSYYTGIYADVGGSGFVATISVPVQYPGGRDRLVLAADVVVDMDILSRLEQARGSYLRTVTEPVSSQAAPGAPWWQPWRTLARSLRPDAPEGLRHEVQVQAEREAREEVWTPQGPLVHRRLGDGRGALFAVQVSRQRWLVGWTRQTPAPVPWGPMLVVPGLLVALLVWAERRWARSERERDAAQGMLDLLDVPLVVVDPNDDTVVRANESARALGLRPGQAFGDRVAQEPDARAHYHREQVAGGGRRRAYGVCLRGDDGESRFVLVRSVSLREPLPGLGAAHHRLALVYVVNDEAELAPVLDEHRDAAHQDERNRLTTLLDHGADTLARVLAGQLGRARDDDGLAFCRWLAEYLLRRLQVTQWVLGHWGGPPRSEAERILGPEHLQGALEQYERIFAVVRADDRLRAGLHWDNGVLCAAPRRGAGEGPVVEAWVDWPEGYRLLVPADGIFGFLLGELLVNAIKHGVPGTTVQLEAEVDRSRRELRLRLRNPVPDPPRAPERGDKSYGGRAITQELARLCGWSLEQGLEGDEFDVRLRCPLTQQRKADEID